MGITSDTENNFQTEKENILSNEKTQESSQKISTIVEICFVLILTGAVCMLGSFQIKPYSETLSNMAAEAGRTILVTGVIVFLYEFWLRNTILKNTQSIYVETTQQTIETINKLGYNIDKINKTIETSYKTAQIKYDHTAQQTDGKISQLSNNLEEINNTIVFSKQAIKSGLVTIHSTRESALTSFTEKINQMHGLEIKVYLCGMSLGDFFLVRNKFYKLFVDWLKTENIKFYMIMIKEKSEASKERAIREETEKYCNIGYEKTSSYIELHAAKMNADFMEGLYPNKIWIKESTTCPLCFLAVVDDTMFMEPYNYACRGSEAPVLEIERSKLGNNNKEIDLFNIYMKHFVSLWIKPNKGEEKVEKLCSEEVCSIMENFPREGLKWTKPET